MGSMNLDLNLFGINLLGKDRSSLWTSGFDDAGPWTFPEGFYWGTAVAAQHVEHNQPSDWTDFELRAARDGLVSGRPGQVVPGHIRNWSAWPAEIRTKKTDFDRRFPEDLAMAAEMGHNSFRFSFDWARLFPTPSLQPDQAGIDFYREMLAQMHKHGLTPFGTLFHFASPQWFWEPLDGKRGWERSDALEHFGRFVEVVAREFGQDVVNWCTLNEPMVYLVNGYIEGLFPPLERRGGIAAVLPVMIRLLEAHGLAYRILHEDARSRRIETSVGITKHTRAFEPLTNWSLLDRHLAAVTEEIFLWSFLDAINTGSVGLPLALTPLRVPGLKGTQDYVGINYYGRFYVQFDILNPITPKIHFSDPALKDEPTSDLGWAIYPHGFYNILCEAHRRYGKPIFVLENGIADGEKNDRRRQTFLVTHIREIWNAIRHAGADIRGYMHWSTMDNFEWAEGFEPRFGLVEVDYHNDFKRIPRPSAELYSAVIRQNGITASMWEQHGST